MTNQITFKFAGDAKPLQSTAKQAHAAISGIAKAALPASSAVGSIGQSLLKSFSPANLASGPMAAAAAIGAVAGMATKAFDIMMDASKKYFEDQKSVTQLNTALINNTDATNGQITAINKQIDRMSILTTIQDDELRRSYTNIVAATKDTTASMHLLQIATDVSAGSGLSMEKVSKALTKAYEGNSSSLQKLLPGVKSGKEGINELADAYKGAGEAVGDASPFQRISLAMENIQETLGMVLAPLITQFADWLTSDDFQTFMDTMTASAIDMANGIAEAMQPLMDLLDFFGSEQFQFLLDLSKRFRPGQSVFDMFKPSGDEKKSTDFMKGLTDSLKDLRENLRDIKGFKFKPAEQVAKAPEIAKRIKDAANSIRESGKKFADALKFDEFLNKDTGIFDASKFMEKFRGIVAAAKALPAKLKALRKAGASPEVLQQIVAMGPEQGLAVAQGFLAQSGSAKEYSKSLQTLNSFGQQAAGVGMTQQNTYEINVTKANMTAEEIIAAIQKYERKTGKKVSFGNG